MARVKKILANRSRLRVLWATTKPPWPPEDGGKLLMAKTLGALDPEQIEVFIAGPWSLQKKQEDAFLAACPALQEILPPPKNGRHSWHLATALAASGLGLGAPFTERKHRNAGVAKLLHQFLRKRHVDVLHAEQPHSLGLLPKTNTPLLLRCQNVEGDLWKGLAEVSRGPKALWLQRQAQAVRRWELACIDQATCTAAISQEDQQRFVALGADPKRLLCLAPAFPARLRSGTASLCGNPPLLLFTGSNWRPNLLGTQSFLQTCWPLMRRRNPEARLHLFGTSPEEPAPKGCIHHRFPEKSRDLFASGSILLVPAQVTSGIRMKILEAWARGIPVITSSAGARGLGPAALQAIAIADQPHEWSEHLHHLTVSQNAALQVEGGRQALRGEHDPVKIAQRLILAYRTVRDASPAYLSG